MHWLHVRRALTEKKDVFFHDNSICNNIVYLSYNYNLILNSLNPNYMKKLIVLTALTALAVLAKAQSQDFHAFKFDIGFGGAEEIGRAHV